MRAKRKHVGAECRHDMRAAASWRAFQALSLN